MYYGAEMAVFFFSSAWRLGHREESVPSVLNFNYSSKEVNSLFDSESKHRATYLKICFVNTVYAYYANSQHRSDNMPFKGFATGFEYEIFGGALVFEAQCWWAQSPEGDIFSCPPANSFAAKPQLSLMLLTPLMFKAKASLHFLQSYGATVTGLGINLGHLQVHLNPCTRAFFHSVPIKM